MAGRNRALITSIGASRAGMPTGFMNTAPPPSSATGSSAAAAAPTAVTIPIAQATGTQRGESTRPVGNRSGIHPKAIDTVSTNVHVEGHATQTAPGRRHPEIAARPRYSVLKNESVNPMPSSTSSHPSGFRGRLTASSVPTNGYVSITEATMRNRIGDGRSGRASAPGRTREANENATIPSDRARRSSASQRSRRVGPSGAGPCAITPSPGATGRCRSGGARRGPSRRARLRQRTAQPGRAAALRRSAPSARRRSGPGRTAGPRHAGRAPQRLEQGERDERGRGDGERVLPRHGREHRLEDDHAADEHRDEDHRHHRPSDRPADQPVDLVQAVARDRHTDAQRNEGKARHRERIEQG